MVFLDHIESLSTSLPVLLGTIETSRERAVQLQTDFFEKDCEIKEIDGNNFYLVKPEFSRRNITLRKEVTRSTLAHKIVQRNYVVSLVSQFDSFLGSLIKTMYYLQPEKLNQSQKQLTFSNLLEFKNINDAREFIIEKEIETVLRDSHAAHFKWLEKQLGTPLTQDLPCWPIFIELTERRNLYVHNNGIVSNQYLDVCDEYGVSFSSRPNTGEELDASLEYFRSAFECIFEIGVKLVQVMWRRIAPDDLEEADLNLLEITFELILNGELKLAQTLLDFAEKNIKKFSSDEMKFNLILNRAQTYKWQGMQDECIKIVNGKDWSACNDVFKLASQVLLDKYDTALVLMKAVGPNNKQLDKNAYRVWPIFNEFRKQQDFDAVFEEIFKEPLVPREMYSATGFKIIDNDILLENLDECLKVAASKTNGFVSAKFFVEKHLAKRGYDIRSSWDLLSILAANGSVETYTHEDPDGNFLPLNALRRPTKADLKVK